MDGIGATRRVVQVVRVLPSTVPVLQVTTGIDASGPGSPFGPAGPAGPCDGVGAVAAVPASVTASGLAASLEAIVRVAARAPAAWGAKRTRRTQLDDGATGARQPPDSTMKSSLFAPATSIERST